MKFKGLAEVDRPHAEKIGTLPRKVTPTKVGYVLRPVMPAVLLCPPTDIKELQLRPVMSTVSLCPWLIFIVPLYPPADTK